MKKTFIGVILLSLMLVVFSSQAMAASAYAKAELDWSNLTISGLGSLFFTNQTTTVEADGKNDIVGTISNAPAPLTNWTTPITVSPLPAVAQAPAIATADSSVLGSYTWAGPTGDVNPESWAYTQRSGVFSYTGAAPQTVIVTIPYALKYVLDATQAPDVYAYGFAQIYYSISRDKMGRLPGQSSGGDEYASDLALNGKYILSDPGKEKGTLSFQLTFYPGNTGTITLGTYSNASASAVPIPAAVWLLGSGLLGLVGIRRRMKA